MQLKCGVCRRKWDWKYDRRRHQPTTCPLPDCRRTSRSTVPTHVDRQAAIEDSKQAEYHATRAQNKRLLKKILVADRIMERADEVLGSMPPVPFPKPVKHDQRTQESALLLWTDHHCGARYTAAEMGGLNHYDIDEYSKRLKYCVQKTIRLLCGRNDCNVRKLVVFLGGDMISGLIHDSLERNADAAPVDQVIIAAWLLSQAIRELAGSFEKIEIVCAPGNHGRLRKPHEMEAVTNSFDTLAYVLVGQHLREQKNVSITIPREWWVRADLEAWWTL